MQTSASDRPVLFVTHSWYGIGGMQKFSRDLWKCLQQEFGSRATLVIPRPASSASRFFFFVRAFIQGVTVTRKGGHIHLGSVGLSFLVVIRLFTTRGTLSASANGLDVVYPSRIYQWMLRKCMSRLKRIVCNSHATLNKIIARGGEANRCLVIPCGAWPDDFHSSPRLDHPLLCIAGRLIPRKGVLWFLREVLPKLLERHPTLFLRIIGDGPERKRIEEEVQRHSPPLPVSLIGAIGFQDRASYVQLLSQANILVMPVLQVPGEMEGFGIVCVEAALCGVPVVASRLQGLTDSVIEGETGTFFESGNAADCIRAIEAMLRCPLESSTVAAVARARYAWPVIFSRYKSDVFFRA